MAYLWVLIGAVRDRLLYTPRPHSPPLLSEPSPGGRTLLIGLSTPSVSTSYWWWSGAILLYHHHFWAVYLGTRALYVPVRIAWYRDSGGYGFPFAVTADPLMFGGQPLHVTGPLLLLSGENLRAGLPSPPSCRPSR